MNVGAMIQLLQTYVDDVVTPSTAVPWLNAGLNKMAIEVKATFPQFVANGSLDSEPVFPEKYHEIPVLYAAAMYRGQDNSRMERADMINDFYAALQNFSENYSPEPQYRDDDLTQQFKATAGQTDFTITKNEFNPLYGNLKVYKNGFTVGFMQNGNTFTLSTEANEGDAITALWEIHADYQEPPYKWWSW